MNSIDYISINRKAWNERSKIHVKSDFYDQESFLNGRNTLNEIELNLIGDINNKELLHLQCHFGQDTLSLARLGAKVTGIDFSTEAIKIAQNTSHQLNIDAKFICCDLYELPSHLDNKFDVVFTSYGTIGWLPDIQKWANIVSHFLKPGGRLIFVEFHPYIWMYDDDFQYLKYSYFNEAEIVEMTQGSYAEKENADTFHSISWNHPLSDVFQALLKHQLTVIDFQEYNYSPYNCFNNMAEFDKGKYYMKIWGKKVPLVYSLVCQK